MSTIIEEISILITSNSFYNKSIDNFHSNISIDKSIFEQLEIYLSKLTNPYEDFLSSNIDYLCPLILFLLEHRSLEIDLNLLTSIETNFQIRSLSSRKLYKPKLISFIQHSFQSDKIFQQLYQLFQIDKFENLLYLQYKTQPIYYHCLQYLQPLLTKTTYDKYPLALQLFIHLIQSIISEIFDWIFPVCLITLDDPSIELKFISLYLLDYLQRNSTTTDLLLFNRANVIMYGLEQNLHYRNDNILFFQCLLTTTFRWLIIFENEIYSGKHLFIRTSQFIERFIRDCLLETNMNYRRELLRILQFYLIRLQLFAIRHLNHLIELLNDAIDIHLLRIDALNLFLIILKLFQPRIHFHRCDFMKILIRCVFKIVDEEKQNSILNNLLKKSIEELHRSTIENYVPDVLKSLIETSELNLIYREYFQTLFNILVET